jgi:RimJ/RimL family protein N-acetyltransferase
VHPCDRTIELVPHTAGAVRALIESVDAYERSFGIKAAPGLRDFFVAAAVSPKYLAQLERATVADPWTDGFAVVHVAMRTVIGAAGFKGPPDAEGIVEIGYGIVPDHCGKGYATAAAQMLVDRAFGETAVQRVRAHTLPEPNPSTRVLTKCGFQHLGEVIDPEDGRVWRWERTR